MIFSEALGSECQHKIRCASWPSSGLYIHSVNNEIVWGGSQNKNTNGARVYLDHLIVNYIDKGNWERVLETTLTYRNTGVPMKMVSYTHRDGARTKDCATPPVPPQHELS